MIKIETKIKEDNVVLTSEYAGKGKDLISEAVAIMINITQACCSSKTEAKMILVEIVQNTIINIGSMPSTEWEVKLND